MLRSQLESIKSSRKALTILTVDFLKECLTHNQETGMLVWNRRPIEHFAKECICQQWNTRYAGKPAGYTCEDGYVRIRITRGGQTFDMLAHYIVACMYGIDVPQDKIIDHKDGIGARNVVSNLRIADYPQNAFNAKLSTRNKSGVTGVAYLKKFNRWQAYIFVRGKSFYLGRFKTKEEAVSARREAELKYCDEFSRSESLGLVSGLTLDEEKWINSIGSL